MSSVYGGKLDAVFSRTGTSAPASKFFLTFKADCEAVEIGCLIIIIHMENYWKTYVLNRHWKSTGFDLEYKN